MIKFVLKGEPVSLNVTKSEHWAVTGRRNKLYLNKIFALAYNAGWRPTMPPFKKVNITFYNWRGDYDNACGGSCKGIVDALVKNDIIKDDNPKECRITYRLDKSDIKGKRVEITLEG